MRLPLTWLNGLWFIVGWLLAYAAPWLAFAPGIELLHILAPAITFALMIATAMAAVRVFRRTGHAIAALPYTASQLLLFTLLFFQIDSHLGASHYDLAYSPQPIDWVMFSAMHGVRAADVLDTFEAYGLTVQRVQHESLLVSGVLIGYHLFVNVFVVTLLFTVWNAIVGRRSKDFGLPYWQFVALFGVIWAFSALWFRPWDRTDIPLWFLDNAIRVLDTTDVMELFHLRFHQVPKTVWEGSLTLICRLLMVTFIFRLMTRHQDTPSDDVSHLASVALLDFIKVASACGIIIAIIGWMPARTVVIPKLVAALNVPSDRSAALHALRRLGSEAESAIVMLVEQDRGVGTNQRIQIVELLGCLGTKAADPLVAEIRDADQTMVDAAMISLRRIGPRASPQLVQIWDEFESPAHQRAEQILLGFGDRAVDPLIASIHDDNLVPTVEWVTQLDRNWYLRRCHHPRMIEVQQAYVELLKAVRAGVPLTERSADVRAAAPASTRLFRWNPGEPLSVDLHQAQLELFGSLGPNAGHMLAFPIEALAHSSDVIRQTAAEALGKVGRRAQSAVPHLIKASLDSSVFVRHDVFVALDRIDKRWIDHESLISLIPEMVVKLNDSNRWVQHSAIQLLSRLEHPPQEVLPVLYRIRDDSEQSWRLNAIELIRRIEAK